MTRDKIVHLIWPPLVIYISFLLLKLAGHESLTTLANDSVHYLVMARHYSPWLNESDAIASAWLLQDFPPFFPWLLAITGTAHSLLYAHLLVIILGLLSLYFYYRLACRWLDDPVLAIFPLLIFSLSPGFLLGLQGILSESLYLLLVLIFMFVYRTGSEKPAVHPLILITLLTAIMLTRTTGLALVMALLAQAFFASAVKKKFQFQPVIIAVLTLSAYYLLMALWGPVKQSHYLGLLIEYLTGADLYGAGSATAVHFSFLTQIKYQLDAWAAFWLLHLESGSVTVPYLIISLLSFASVAGLILRLLKNKYDAWYALFFIVILLMWPHPGQLFRLVFPIMPLLLIYAGYAVIKLLELRAENTHKVLIAGLFYLSILAVTLPSHAFIHARLSLAESRNMIPVYETFRHANQFVASQELVLQNQMMNDFTHLTETVPANEKILYFKPSYLAALSDRTGIAAPSPINPGNYLSLVIQSGARYIFLTRLHPRNTRLGYSGFQGIEHLQGWTEIVWCSQIKQDEYASCLIRVVDQP